MTPHLTILEQKFEVETLVFVVVKDGKDFAYTNHMADARMIKIACDDWFIRAKREKRCASQ